MGKIRVAVLGDELEKEQKRRADARRQTKASKKAKVAGVGLHGGQRIAVPDGGDLKPEFKKIVEEVESGASSEAASKKTPKKRKNPTRSRSKKYVEAASLVDKTKLYPLAEAISLVKKTSFTKFDGSVEMHINLNPSVMGDKKDFRGSVTLPHGTGKEVRVAIADDDILTKVESGKIDFDILVAHPSMMPRLAKVARILGPRGLMPNPKTGTVSPDPEKRAKELSHGQVNFKTEPDQPIIHMSIGKVSFDEQKLMGNITAVLGAIDKNKVTRVTLASTMGPGIKVAIN
ncbi:50S ribosomal protein L1 [Candidatus Gottesmanbacteria bacterium]|nr:50S ribosomal protein L1 [Candidatus Gottesmanbacteria bacterium]